jgi:hypothetical protein
MDEVDFVNAAQGAPDNTMIHIRLGSVPLFLSCPIWALKAWLYTPVFWLFGVSALTIRLPAILLAGVTLLILFQFMRARLGAVCLIGAAQPASCTRTQGTAAADARLLAGFPKPGKGNQER